MGEEAVLADSGRVRKLRAVGDQSDPIPFSQALPEKLNVPVFRIQTWTWLLQIDLIGRAPSAAERNEHTLIREILQIPRRRGL